jgi:hypothetical protein
MSTSMIVRRSVAVLASAGAAGALALVPAGGAQAQVQAEYAAGGSANAEFVGSGGGDCNLISAPDSDNVLTTPVIFGHGTKHASANLSATFQSSLNLSDQVHVKGHTDTTLTVKRQPNKDLSSFDLTAGGSLKITHTVIPSQCHASGVMGGLIEGALFTEHKKGYFYLTRDTLKPDSETEFILYNEQTDQEVAFEFYAGGASHATSRALLKPGTYAIEETITAVTAGGVQPEAKTAQRSTKVAQTVELNGQFKPLKNKHHRH